MLDHKPAIYEDVDSALREICLDYRYNVNVGGCAHLALLLYFFLRKNTTNKVCIRSTFWSFTSGPLPTNDFYADLERHMLIHTFVVVNDTHHLNNDYEYEEEDEDYASTDICPVWLLERLHHDVWNMMFDRHDLCRIRKELYMAGMNTSILPWPEGPSPIYPFEEIYPL